VEAVMVETMVVETAGGCRTRREGGKSNRGGGSESQCKLLHGHLLSLWDATRCG
jgi:hypothetical protein